MKVWPDENETVGETIRQWYCDHCGKRYPEPGTCTDGHASQPVELQEVNDPVNPPEDDTPVEPTEEEKNQAIADQGKDVTIANQAAHIKQLEDRLASQAQYISQLEEQLKPASDSEGGQ